MGVETGQLPPGNGFLGLEEYLTNFNIPSHYILNISSSILYELRVERKYICLLERCDHSPILQVIQYKGITWPITNALRSIAFVREQLENDIRGDRIANQIQE